MLRELLSIFKVSDPLHEMGQNFRRMLALTYEMNAAAGQAYFGESADATVRQQVRVQDIRVNEFERAIRRQLVTHLSLPGNQADVPYSLLLMSVAKDVERLGDYAKNLSEIGEIQPPPLPPGKALDDLQSIRRGVERAYQATAEIFEGSRKDEAMTLIRAGREIARRCDQLVVEIGQSDYDAATTTALILGVRYYKRIGGHVLNILSSVVMPLDKVDYYDEDAAASFETLERS